MLPTSDPYVFIEEQRQGYTRYRQVGADGNAARRWEVHGVCDRRGDCLIGAVVDTPDGSVKVRDHKHLEELADEMGRERIDSHLDVPVTPEFRGCCPFAYVELPV